MGGMPLAEEGDQRGVCSGTWGHCLQVVQAERLSHGGSFGQAYRRMDTVTRNWPRPGSRFGAKHQKNMEGEHEK